MSLKSLLRLSLIALFLLVAVVLLRALAGKKPARPRLWPSGSQDKILHIVLRSSQSSASLEWKKDRWETTTPLRFPADSPSIQELLKNLRKASLSDFLTENPSRYPVFEVSESSAIRVRLFSLKPSPVLDLFVGKEGTQGDSAYVRYSENPKVYEAYGLSRYRIDRPGPLGWMDKTICSIPKDSVQSLAVSYSGGSVFLSRKEDRWYRNATALSSATVEHAINPILEALSRLESDSLELSYNSLKKTLGLARPFLQVQVGWKGEKFDSLVLKIGRQNPERYRYLKKAGEDRVLYLISEWKLEPFQKTKKDFN